MLKPYKEVEETEEYVVYEFRTIYTYILYFILLIVFSGTITDITPLFYVGFTLMIFYCLIVSSQYWILGRVIKRAARNGSVEMSGSKSSFSHPLQVKIKKELI